MPTALLTPQIEFVPNSPRRKQWTRTELSGIEAAGLLVNQKLELIEGELIQKMGKNRPHCAGLLLMLQYLAGVFTLSRIQPEMPIDVHPEDNPTSEPEPDLAVYNRHVNSIRSGNHVAADALLVCEISDTSLAFDLRTKANLYARAGIIEYWVLDVNNPRLIVHREPSMTGYLSVQVYRPDESIAPLAAPHAQTLVSAFFN